MPIFRARLKPKAFEVSKGQSKSTNFMSFVITSYQTSHGYSSASTYTTARNPDSLVTALLPVRADTVALKSRLKRPRTADDGTAPSTTSGWAVILFLELPLTLLGHFTSFAGSN